ncbi:ABC transporter membrane protein [Klebsiella pneumoniae]|nr:ABC transporter membrane protein [Klebsiella pneumoniae]
MFHRLWTLIRKELQSLLREPQTRAILIMPVLIQVLLFPFAATLEVTNATIAIYNEDSGRHAVELTQRFARAKAFTHVLLLQSPQAIQPTIDEQKALLVVRFPADFSRNLDNYQNRPAAASARRTQLQQRANRRQLSATDCEKLSAGAAGG